MKRYVSIWCPHWATDRWRRQRASPRDRPLVLTAPATGGLRLTAVDALAQDEGLHPGQRLADARALVPYLQAADADPLADAEALGRLADWCVRYTPWSSTDGEDGIILDITGCAHLFGGEEALIADLVSRLATFGITARAAAADTPGAAWAWAHFGDGNILGVGESRAKLAPLPVEALRLAPETVEQLRRLGLREIRDIVPLPRGPLATRLGRDVLTRLDRALGVEAEAISPRRPAALWRVRLAFAEAISLRGDLDRATLELLGRLCRALEAEGRGARRLELAFYRVDGTVQVIDIGTSRPSRDAAHLARLFEEKLGTVAPGFGIETMILGALETAPLQPSQRELTQAARESEGLGQVIDRLQGRLGRNAVVSLVPVDSHIPERAVVVAPAEAGPPAHAEAWPDRPRPVRLLAAPEPIEMGEAEFRWRRGTHRIARREGPERIAPEWWRSGSEDARDYFWLEDERGRRYWVFCVLGARPAWYLHGLFA